ncbi:hypothetical protein MSG28_001429 [Choristoneura fumiferana]|uniref:Uncharacterized protein n=1 Tax=Choristoneura fumiferana TaxID=7141 RepID=A0ACC0KV65_CHOFU|nr:hypothetical protein MSG28_001429 [Choristoneura fumiferana]
MFKVPNNFSNLFHNYKSIVLCNMKQWIGMANEDVQFCGYTVPHPAEAKMHFRIQTYETPALEILKRGLKDLEKVCDHTVNLFESEVKEFCKS